MLPAVRAKADLNRIVFNLVLNEKPWRRLELQNYFNYIRVRSFILTGAPSRALMGTPEFDKSRDERKKVEMRFAHLKSHHRFERMRGLSGARDEFYLVAIVQNLKTLAIHIGHPPPGVQVACVA
jgi:hypothetical protein